MIRFLALKLINEDQSLMLKSGMLYSRQVIELY